MWAREGEKERDGLGQTLDVGDVDPIIWVLWY